MKTAISIILFLIVCAMLAGVEISLNPFRIQFHQWERLVGYILLIFAFVFLNFSAYKEGFEHGYKKCLDHVMEIINKQENQDEKP